MRGTIERRARPGARQRRRLRDGGHAEQRDHALGPRLRAGARRLRARRAAGRRAAVRSAIGGVARCRASALLVDAGEQRRRAAARRWQCALRTSAAMLSAGQPARQPMPMASDRCSHGLLSAASRWTIARPASRPASHETGRPGRRGRSASITRSPPSSMCRRISSACVSSVTALTTSRPPGRSAGPGRVEDGRVGAAAADEDGVGRGQALRARPARLRLTIVQVGNAERRAHCGRRARRDRRAARWRWRGWRDGAASIRCRPSRSPRRRPTAVRPGAARAPRA